MPNGILRIMLLCCVSGRMRRRCRAQLGVAGTQSRLVDGTLQRVTGNVVPHLQRSSLGWHNGQLQQR